jgi:hypothetical protein
LPKWAFFPRNKPNFHREFNAGNSVPDPVTMRYRRSLRERTAPIDSSWCG